MRPVSSVAPSRSVLTSRMVVAPAAPGTGASVSVSSDNEAATSAGSSEVTWCDVGDPEFVHDGGGGRHVVEGVVVNEIKAAVLDDEAGHGAVEKIGGVAAGVDVGEEVGHGDRDGVDEKGEVDGLGCHSDADVDPGGFGDVGIAEMGGQIQGEGSGAGAKTCAGRGAASSGGRFAAKADGEGAGRQGCPLVKGSPSTSCR